MESQWFSVIRPNKNEWNKSTLQFLTLHQLIIWHNLKFFIIFYKIIAIYSVLFRYYARWCAYFNSFEAYFRFMNRISYIANISRIFPFPLPLSLDCALFTNETHTFFMKISYTLCRSVQCPFAFSIWNILNVVLWIN